MKDLGVNSAGSLTSGIVFMLSGYLLSVHSLLSCFLSVIWTPLIMLFFRKALIHPKFKNEFLTAFFLTISFLGGGVEIVYGNFFILLFMIIFSTPSFSPYYKSIWRQIRLGVKSLFVISIIFLLLSAIQILPFVELLRHSIRWGGISYNEATIWSFSPKDILLFFLPDAYGYFLDPQKYWQTQCWLKTLYTGGFPFILGSFFFLFGKNRRLYLSLMLFSIFISLGQYNPLYPFVFKYIPFFNGIRYPVKFLYIFILCLSIISGLGFQRLMEFSRNSDDKALKNLLIIFSLTSGLILVFLILGHKEVAHFLKLKGIDFPDFNYLSVNLYHAKRFLFYLTLFFLLMRLGYEVKWKGWVKVLFIFFLTADLFGNMGFYGKEKTSDYFKKTRILEIISSDKGTFRTFTTGKTISMDTPILIGGASPLSILKEKHPPSLNLLHRLHDIWGIDVVRLKRVDDLYKALTGASSISATNLTDLYSVKYIISVTPIKDNPRFKLIYSRIEGLQGEKEDLLQKNTVKLYKNCNVLPRAWLVKDFKVLDQKKMISTITSKEFNPRKEVLLEEKPKWKITHGSSGGPGKSHLWPQDRVEFTSESNNKLSLLVKAKGDAFLVLSDTYFPGWRVFIDGRGGEIYQADYNFRAVPLGAGIHHVEFVYDPLSFKLGAIITFLGIMGCLVIGLGIRHRKQ
jgi:hypothetical protein